jgi:tetratricopeptide (TPR) repeat protein
VLSTVAIAMSQLAVAPCTLTRGYHAGALMNLGRTQEAFPLAMQGWSVAQTIDDPLLRISARFFVGQVHTRMGALRAALESLGGDIGLPTDRLIELASDRTAGGTLYARSALTSYMFMRVESSFDYLELGGFEAAAQQVREAEHIAESVDLVYFRALAEMAGGCLHLYRGAPALAIPMLERSLKRGDDADFPGAIIHSAWGPGHAYNLTQRPREAAAVLQRGWDLAESGGFLHFGVSCLMHLADAHSLAGDEAKALATIDRALVVARDGSFRAREAWALFVQGNILARGSRTDVQSALRAYQAVLALAGDLEMRPLVAHCQFGLGMLARECAQPPQAREHLTEGGTMFREMGRQPWVEKSDDALRAM